MLNVVLVDDEILALNLLEAILLEIGNIKVIGKFLNPLEGLAQVEILEPDVVFLDIEMPEMTGMAVAEKINTLQTDIVFVTAYEQYALEAFNVQAVDYVLKPIEKTRLMKTVERILYRRKEEGTSTEEDNILHARFLGNFQLIGKDNEPIKWRTKKVKELCAYLLHHIEPVHRDKIMEDLWPEHSYDKASALLHTTVYQLRKKFKDVGHDNPIQFVDERYKLMVVSESDIQELKDMLNAKNIEGLLQLYQEEYLSFEDYQWSLETKEKIHKSFVRHLDNFIFTASEEVKNHGIFKKVLEKLSKLEPWEEKYVLELVKYYVRQGQYKEATNLYNKYKESLKKELGIEPRNELEELISRYEKTPVK